MNKTKKKNQINEMEQTGNRERDDGINLKVNQ